jgi:hypothetical protein
MEGNWHDRDIMSWWQKKTCGKAASSKDGYRKTAPPVMVVRGCM